MPQFFLFLFLTRSFPLFVLLFPKSCLWWRVSRKLRPRKLRPQTLKTQTLWVSRKVRPEKLRPSGCLENSDPKNSGYVYTIPDSLCADTKTISDRASVHTGITNFGAVFTTERRCAASILKVNRHVSDRFGPSLFTLCRSVFHVGTKSYPV